MDIPQLLLAAFPPSRERLLELVRKAVDDEMLREIAHADYGWEADVAFAELKPIRDTGRLPENAIFRLVEVLRLTSFLDPQRSDLREHNKRLFACMVLLLTVFDKYCDDTVLAQSLSSSLALGHEASRALGSLVTWLWQHHDLGTDSLPWQLGLLVLLVRLKRDDEAESRLNEVAGWIVANEAKTRNERIGRYDADDPPPAWFGVQQGFWHPSLEELRRAADTSRSDELRSNLQLCALLLEA